MTVSEAMKEAYQPITMEFYFQKGNGLFMVENEAVDSGDIFSPYTQERYHSPLEDECPEGYFQVDGLAVQKYMQQEGFEENSIKRSEPNSYFVNISWADNNDLFIIEH